MGPPARSDGSFKTESLSPILNVTSGKSLSLRWILAANLSKVIPSPKIFAALLSSFNGISVTDYYIKSLFLFSKPPILFIVVKLANLLLYI